MTAKSFILTLLGVAVIVLVGFVVGYFFREDLKQDEDELKMEITEKLKLAAENSANASASASPNYKTLNNKKTDHADELEVDGEESFFDNGFLGDDRMVEMNNSKL